MVNLVTVVGLYKTAGLLSVLGNLVNRSPANGENICTVGTVPESNSVDPRDELFRTTVHH